MDNLWQDIRFSIRSMLKKPTFTAIALLALALGIGANTALFSIIYSVLLKPLPFAQPDKLVMVWNTVDGNGRFIFTYPDFIDYRERNQSFEYLAAYNTRDFTLTGIGEPLRLRGARVTAGTLPLLGVQPKLGRYFTTEEDKPGNRVVILSNRVWKERFSSSADLLNQSITIDGQSYTVVGVMPEKFIFPLQSDPQVDLWTTTATMQEGNPPLTTQRGNHALEVIGRLKANVSVQQAQADVTAIASNLESQYPDSNNGFGARVVSLHQEIVKDVNTALWILFAAVGCVLLIACANVANLLLARASTRSKEMAIRTSLGAARGRIIRQLLTESVMLSCAGGILGLLLAMWGTDWMLSLLPEGLPRAAEIQFDMRVLGFTFFLSVLTGLLFGIAPALQLSKANLTQSLKEGGRSSNDGSGGNRVRSVLIVAEVAIALMLLVTAGLLINSFLHLQQLKPGFETSNILSFRISLPDTRYPENQQIIDFNKQVSERLKTIPGVKDVAYTSALPFSGQGGGVGFAIEGEPVNSARPFPYGSDYRTVSPGYFRTLGIQVAQGRDFDERDTFQSTPVVIINQALADKYFPNQNPIGRRINPSFAVDNRGILMREIVGVVGNVKHVNLNEEQRFEVYIAHAQNPGSRMTFAVRTTNDPVSTIAAVRSEVQSLDRDLPVFNIRTMEEYVSSSVAQPRFNTLLLSLFAGVALLLTIVGLYGVMSYSVTQRTHEIGLRMALGAQAGDVLRMIIKQGMGLTLFGVVLGLAGAFALSRLAESLLFGVTATDPLTFAAVSAILLGVALVACFVPARRAANTDPMVALRYE